MNDTTVWCQNASVTEPQREDCEAVGGMGGGCGMDRKGFDLPGSEPMFAEKKVSDSEA